MDEQTKLEEELTKLARDSGIAGAARLVKAAKAKGLTGKNLELSARAVIARSADKIFTAPVPSTGAVSSTVPKLAPDGTVPPDAADETWQVDTAHLTARSMECGFLQERWGCHLLRAPAPWVPLRLGPLLTVELTPATHWKRLQIAD